MTSAIELYGAFVLTFLGFIVPFLTILISLFPEGIKSLTEKYENERKQSEENIINSNAEKEKKEDGLDYNALTKTLKTLKKKKRDAEFKLQYLKPGGFLLRTSIPLFIAFAGVIEALLSPENTYVVIALLSSSLGFVVGLVSFFICTSLLFEVSEIVNEKKNHNEEKIIELLSTLVEKYEEVYIKENQLKVIFNGEKLEEDSSLDFSLNSKHEIPVIIWNNCEKMAKKVEVGFIFPSEVIIEKTSNISIYSHELSQIVRFNQEIIQANEYNEQDKLSITFLKAGTFNVKTFIKGENVKYNSFKIKLNIIK